MMTKNHRYLKSRWHTILLSVILFTLLLSGCGSDEKAPTVEVIKVTVEPTVVVEVATVPVETAEVDPTEAMLEAIATDLKSDNEDTILAAFDVIDEELTGEEPDAAIALLEENADILIALMEHESIEICRTATWFLTSVETERAFEAIVSALDHPDSSVRMAVLWELVEREDPRTIDALSQAFSPDSGIALDYLFMLLDELEDGAEEVLTQALEVADASVLPKIIDRLVGMESEEAIPQLIDLLGREDYDGRIEVIESLGAIGNPTAVPTLLSLLEDEDVKIRTAAVKALGNFEDPAMFETLVELLEDDAPVIQKAAANSLCKFSEATLAPLFDSLWNLDLEQVTKTYRFFIAWGEPGSEAILGLALRDFGDQSMALAFLNSGNEVLEEAGRTWADENGYNVVTMPSVGGSSGGWGSGQ